MADDAELEFALDRLADGRYRLDVRFSPPGADALVRPLQDAAPAITLDLAALQAHHSDPIAYGRLLAEQFFAEPAVRDAFTRARDIAAGAERPLRLRLLIGASAPELHGVRWETLHDPQGDGFLLLGEQILFARYLTSDDWSPMRFSPRPALHALVVIANPNDLTFYRLAPVDVPAELERARIGLGEIALTSLAAPGRATLDQIFAVLREEVDILYLVAHGAHIDGETWLWLEDEHGRTARVAGRDLAERLRDLERRPRLAVLMACESAAESHFSAETDALIALGPRLAAVGVPAVLAMQGNISQATAGRFMQVFFERLLATGEVDRATAAARGAVRERSDAWAPLLYTRLRSGRILADAEPDGAALPAEHADDPADAIWLRYQNVDLELFDYQPQADGAQFRVRVVQAPHGSQSVAEADLVVLPAVLQHQLRSLATLDRAALITIGQALAELLFPPRTRVLVQQSRAALAANEALRLRLKPTTPELAALPWEYAYWPAHPGDGVEGFLALDRQVALVRYDVGAQPPRHSFPPVRDALQVVSIVADLPVPDLPALAPAGEQDRLRQALKATQGVALSTVANATVERLEEALGAGTHSVHFTGHAERSAAGTSAVWLLDDQLQPLRFPAETLALNLVQRGVRLVVLGGGVVPKPGEDHPWIGLAWELAQAGLPAVLALPASMRESSVITFLRRFYRALIAGQPVEAAVADGRLAIFNRTLETEHDWGVPVLTLGSADGTIFPRTQALSAGQHWDDLLDRARSHSSRVLREATGLADQPGVYVPEAYVARSVAEAELNGLLLGSAQGMVLVGDSGNGKTNLLCRWTEQLLESGNAAFLFNCSASLDDPIEREVARAFALDNAASLDSALERVAEMASRAGRRCVLIFDGLNMYRDGKGGGPAHLLRQLDALVGRLPAPHLALVLSCNSVGWSQFERQDATRLFWSRYHRSAAGDQVVQLEPFSDAEFAAAYERYRNLYQLTTPLAALNATARERLRRPLLLRMIAEGYRGRDVAVAARGTAVSIFGRYFDERVKLRQDRLFIDEFARELLQRRVAALPMDDLLQNATLREAILSNDFNNSYVRLLDAGVLTETPGDLFRGDVVHFTYGQVGGYALAQYLLRRSGSAPELLNTLQALARYAPTFALGWDTARVVLLLYRRPEVFAELVRSTAVEPRTLAVEALVELYGEHPELALTTVNQLIRQDSEESRRAGLMAAYYIGPGARELFLWAAIKGSPALRQAAKVTLYLIWQSDPAFPYHLLNELVARLTVARLLEWGPILEFVIDLSVTIYINHPERADVVRETNDLHYEMCKSRLRLQVFGNKLLDPVINVLIQAMASAFSRPIMDAMMFSELMPPERFFALPAHERAALTRVVPFLDPATDLRQARDELLPLLNHQIPIFNVVAALVVCVHAYQHFAAVEPLVRDMWADLSGHGRLWLLVGFSFLVTDTPPAWTPLLEDLTRRAHSEHPELFDNPAELLGAQFDILLLPLGLAYGKAGGAMPIIGECISAVQDDRPRLRRLVAGLAAVGFYYPQPVFDLLRERVPDLLADDLRPTLVRTLATIRTRHFDAVDAFLDRIGADDALQRAISAETDPELVRRYVMWLGLYNNAVHFCARYPIMREGFAQRGITLISQVGRPDEFVAQYTISTFQLGRAADYRFTNWTRRTEALS